MYKSKYYYVYHPKKGQTVEILRGFYWFVALRYKIKKALGVQCHEDSWLPPPPQKKLNTLN